MTGAIRYTLVAIIISLVTIYIDKVDTSLLIYCMCYLLRAVLWYSAGLSWGDDGLEKGEIINDYMCSN